MKKEMPTEQELIEANNLIEEACEIFEKCTSCGLCKSLCPTFKVLMEEKVSPRGHAILLSDKILDKVVYECTMCKACEQKCPINIKICDAIQKAREALILKRKGLEKNEEMIKRFKKTGNIFEKDNTDY
jgi:glycolate oxidase iron-sulfur subunit